MSEATPPSEGAAEAPAAPAVAVNVTVEPTPPLRAIDIVRRRSAAARRMVVVPEWEDMQIWFGKLTVSDMEATGDRVSAAKQPLTTLERNIVLVIVKAENEDGTPVFAMGDLHFLKTEAEFAVVQRLIDFMFGAALPTAEAEADRIAEDPPSSSG